MGRQRFISFGAAEYIAGLFERYAAFADRQNARQYIHEKLIEKAKERLMTTELTGE